MEKILFDILAQCGMSEDRVKSLSIEQKMPFYKMFKTKLDTYRKNKESNIRKTYEERKKADIIKMTKEVDNTEAMLLGMLNLGVSKRRKTLTENIKNDIWKHKFGPSIDGICTLCNTEKVCKFSFIEGYIIPESKGGQSDQQNITPICEKCQIHLADTKENMIEYLNRVRPLNVTEHDSLFENIVKAYNFFHYNQQTGEITFPQCVSDMEQYMCLCQTKFDMLNTDFKGILNTNIMKISNIIRYDGELNMTNYTGNSAEKCYYLDIVLMRQYLRIMEPYVEPVKTNPFQLEEVDSIFGTNSNTPSYNSSSNYTSPFSDLDPFSKFKYNNNKFNY